MPDAETPKDPSRAGSRQRVWELLSERGWTDRLVEFEQSTKTAQMAADAVGCELGQIVKSLVFVVDGGAVLALVAGDRRGDGDAIAAESGGDRAAMADPDTVRAATGYAIGGVCPFGLPRGLSVLVDDSLERFTTVYPAGGTPSSMVRLTLEELLEVTGGRMARVSHACPS